VGVPYEIPRRVVSIRGRLVPGFCPIMSKDSVGEVEVPQGDGSFAYDCFLQANDTFGCLRVSGRLYTGLPLDWSLISAWDNDSATRGGAQYKKSFAEVPTVDHTVDENGSLRFVICASYVNHAKSDLTVDEFYQLCERVLSHRERKATNK